MQNKKLILVAALAGICTISHGAVLTLQTGLNGYNGTQDICMYSDHGDGKPLGHFTSGTFNKTNPVFALGYYDC